ncbi:MAG: 4Fe-4S dicluster domain-containing protein [Oscillospiraceae bacterium]|nr:4Fe-4S dicluster domain-containing protein [Oscillospiraceae bacterium]
MDIIQEKCVGCGHCAIFCPMHAITVNAVAHIDPEKCVECFNCVRSGCPADAIKPSKLSWPQSLAESLSNPTGVDEKSGVSGRGTAEMKTNEVTGRIGHGKVGLCMELGRPGTGTTFADVEKICMTLARHGVIFEPLNPVTYVMKDTTTGEMKEEVRNVRVLSAIVEGLTDADKLEEVLRDCYEASKQIDTVFSVGVSSLVRQDGTTYFDDAIEALGLEMYESGKTNVGLGYPRFDFQGGSK